MRLRVLDDAEAELIAAMHYYEDCREGLGEEFYERAYTSISAVAENPLRFPIYESKRLVRVFRRARIARFPYIVVFEMRPDETLVVAIAHTSREPGYWANRGE